MKWLKKKIYKKGPGSPGELARTIAKAYSEYTQIGMQKQEALKKIYNNYIQNYQIMGLYVSENAKVDEFEEIKHDIALVIFMLLLLGNSNNPNGFDQIRQDLDLVLDVIIEELNGILGGYRLKESIDSKWIEKALFVYEPPSDLF